MSKKSIPYYQRAFYNSERETPTIWARSYLMYPTIGIVQITTVFCATPYKSEIRYLHRTTGEIDIMLGAVPTYFSSRGWTCAPATDWAHGFVDADPYLEDIRDMIHIGKGPVSAL